MTKLVGASLKMLYRDRQGLFWALMFPVIFTVVFGLFDFDRPPEIDIAIVSDRPTPVAQAIERGLESVDSFTVETVSSRDAAVRGLREGDYGLVVVVPQPDPAGRGAVETLYDTRTAQRSSGAITVVRQMVAGANLAIAGVISPPMTVTETPVDGESVKYYDFLLPGLVAMGVMNFAVVGMAIAITRFREQRILKRITATPLAPVRFLGAQVLARLILSIVQAAVILAVGVGVFGAQIYGNILWLFVLAAMANLIFLNVGFAVAGRAGSSDAAQGLAQAVVLPMTFLSGVFFPVDTLPSIMQSIVAWLPLTPLIEAMREVALDGGSIASVGSQMLKLSGWLIVSFVIAARMFRFSRA